MTLSKITVETLIAAPLAKVWSCYTTPADIIHWNAASDDWHTTKAEVDLRAGGAFSSRMEAKDGSFGFDFAGTYTHVDEHKSIAYAFGDRTAEITFDATPSGVAICVTFDPETTHPIAQQQEGWQSILNNFKRYVETQFAA